MNAELLFLSRQKICFFTNDRVVFGLINQYQMYCDKVNSVDELINR